MKQLLLAGLLLAGLAPAACAQSANPAVWCPPGATWKYGWALFSERGTITVRYARDTAVAGQPAQLLTRQLLAYDAAYPGSSYLVRMSSVITRTVGDRVEVQANGQFYTLYNFAAQPGSSWLTPRVVPYGPCPAELVQATVDSVGTQQLAGRSLRWLRVHLTSPAGAAVLGYWGGRIYEQIGDLGYMQPQSPLCGGSDPGYMGSFISFQAAGWPSIVPSPSHSSLVLGTTQARAAAASFSVYPNPGTGYLTLELPATLAPTATLRLLDLTGRTVQQLAVPASRRLNVSGWPAGAYTLLLESVGQPPLAQRLAIQ